MRVSLAVALVFSGQVIGFASARLRTLIPSVDVRSSERDGYGAGEREMKRRLSHMYERDLGSSSNREEPSPYRRVIPVDIRGKTRRFEELLEG